MRIPCLVVPAVLFLVMAGCSSQPQAVAPAKPVPAIAMAEKAPATTVAAVGDEDEFKPPAGYKRKVDNGRIYYCTKITVLGSRFPKDDCRTQQELAEAEVAKAEMHGRMMQNQSVCTSGCSAPPGT